MQRCQLFFTAMIVMLTLFAVSSCSDRNDTFDICWESNSGDKAGENMAVLLDTQDQIIGKYQFVIEDEEIKYLYDSMHFSPSDVQYRELSSLLEKRGMRRILTAGGHYNYDGISINPAFTYRVMVSCGDSDYVITYDLSILGAVSGELTSLRNLHLFLEEMVMQAEGYDDLLSDYRDSPSPFD